MLFSSPPPAGASTPSVSDARLQLQVHSAPLHYNADNSTECYQIVKHHGAAGHRNMFRIKKGAIVRNVLLPEVQCVVDRIVVRNTWGSGRASGGGRWCSDRPFDC